MDRDGISRNIETMNKRRMGRRSGGMLVLVLIIMAVGVILITSAMSITVAARDRFYDDAMTGQGRLTATAAVKTIVNAVETQEILDSELEILAANNAVVNVTSASGSQKTAGAANDNSVSPGLATSTYATFSYYPDAASKTYIKIEVATSINVFGEATPDTEYVACYLEKKPDVPAVEGFTGMLNLGGEGVANTFNNFYVGDPTGYTADQVTSNYVVVNGTITAGTGSTKYYSDVVFTGLLKSGGGNEYLGNIVFWGDDAGIASSGGCGAQTSEHILWIGETPGGASVFRDSSGNAATGSSFAGGIIGDKGQYFENTVAKKDGWGQFVTGEDFFIGSNATFFDYTNWFSTPYTGGAVMNLDGTVKYSPESVDLDASIVASSPNASYDSSSIKAAVQKYTDPDIVAQIQHSLPSTAEAKTLVAYSSSADITTNTTQLSNLSTSATYTGTSYYINASATNLVSGDLEFDLTNNDITVYVIGSGSTLTVGQLSSGKGSITFTNGGSHWGRIVLLENVNLILEKNNYSTWMGIISTTHSSGVKTTGDAGTKPKLYIIGFGGNTITARQYAILDAYVGLYGTDGTFIADNGPKFYGRIETTNISSNSSFLYLDYCPAPFEDEGSAAQEPLVSQYMVNSYQYY